MPTNLPPEAQELERLYRAAETVQEKISTLEDYISAIPKHKGTDHLRADLRRKLSKLKSSAQTRKGAARQVSPSSPQVTTTVASPVIPLSWSIAKI